MSSSYKPRFAVAANDVHKVLSQHMLADGFAMVLDLDESEGSYMVDARDGRKYLDFFTCFASMPIGVNHPGLNNPEFIEYLGKASINKPSNSDLYTEVMAVFVKTFFELAVPDHFKYSFYIEGGGLAVENALKTAFDWKVQHNFKKGYTSERGHMAMHYRQSFHGRTGYTMSLTNTDPIKTQYFPQFGDWPRIHNPAVRFPLNEANLAQVMQEEKTALDAIKQAFFEHRDHIASIIVEPIQGEGGDNHFRTEFLAAVKQLCLENDALLIFDEVQTGVGITGTMWAHEGIGVQPDLMSFGKKMQVCGILAGERVDEVENNVFHASSRINSTWGGNLTDMVRATRYLEIIDDENLVHNAATLGSTLLQKLQGLAQSHPNLVSNPRGRGLFCAFDLPNNEQRGAFAKACMEKGLLMIASGDRSMRFRPPLNLSSAELEEGMQIVENVLQSMS